ncbi:uncharacterized protein CELE_F36G9.15 [Caenorhabditis elegans]|uniref:Uncharacterized protein n=1 Tax=Caenorhabditis elegans TaxID=6239 RepID=O45468_CAEEL|nr:Uncharacterized protein CELE_F36G9.15 [Caenorhabditis elegans]CAB04329.1 Uncharacterized protein CELE_F36G9.15 [Caenorhabditis elegans]|eukprot:NP_507010.1 Uncharacterized protein CELE_F36G9.15 [Caenorhabditis elegans]
MLMFSIYFQSITLLFGPFLLLIVFIVNCQSKKKFKEDGRAKLVPRNAPVCPDPAKEKSAQTCPTAQTPPAKTPMERSGSAVEDTLANVKSLPPEKSDDDDKPKKKKKKN